MANILIIDDDKIMAEIIARIAGGEGHTVRMEHDLENAREALRAGPENGGGDWDLVFLDIHLPDGNSLTDFLPELRGITDGPEIIMITSSDDPDGAEIALKNGAWDYILKPATPRDLQLSLQRALQYRGEKQSAAPMALRREGIIGESPALRECLDQVARAAAGTAPVLITGETGTGKELLSRAVHINSSRAQGPYVIVDCASLPETLAEAMLFGHKKGAFTGADRDRTGLIREAHGGTLVLDEIGELPPALQKNFLRVLETRRFRPLGEGKEVESDFRLVAATNRDPAAMVEAGDFRRDLLHRIRSLHIHIPPLRERTDDIRELTVHHLDALSERAGTESRGFSPDFIEALRKHQWPGNVRELVRALEHAWSAARGKGTLFAMHLPVEIRVSTARAGIAAKVGSPNTSGDSQASGDSQGDDTSPTADGPSPADSPAPAFGDSMPSFKEFREEVMAREEHRYFTELMRRTERNIGEAQNIADVSRTRLYELLKKHGLSRGD